MRLALVGFLALFASGIAYAASVAPPVKQPEEICEEVLRHLIKCDPAGLDVLKTHLGRTGDPAKDARLDAISGRWGEEEWTDWFHGQMATARQLTKQHGEPIGFSLVAAHQVGDSLKRFTYLCKYQKDWTRWQFTFYKPDSRWMLLGFKFDQNEEALFSECGHDETSVTNAASYRDTQFNR